MLNTFGSFILETLHRYEIDRKALHLVPQMQHYVQLIYEKPSADELRPLNKTYLAYVVEVWKPCEIQPSICLLTDTEGLNQFTITFLVSYLHFYFRYYLSDVQEPICQIIWPSLRLLLFDPRSALALGSHKAAGHLRIRSSRTVAGSSCRNSVLSTPSRSDCLDLDPDRANPSNLPRPHPAAYFDFRRRKLNNDWVN